MTWRSLLFLGHQPHDGCLTSATECEVVARIGGMERVCSIVCEPPLYWLSPSPHSPSLRHRQGRSSLAGPGVTAATLGAQGSHTGYRWFPPSHVVSMGGVSHRRVGALTAEDASSVNLYRYCFHFLCGLNTHVLQVRFLSQVSPDLHGAFDKPTRMRRSTAESGLQLRRTCADTARHFAAL
ncbi:hypothetical protein B0H11DRAFT_2125503 [Mycena galericulata]|nr:hypothetical protein B0H11DRAFT_2125503 [Mycena galericulata]